MRYSTYSTYCMDPGGSGCSVGCLVRYSTYSTYSMDPGGSGCSVGCLVRYSTYSTYSIVEVQRVAQLCVFGQDGLTSPARVCAKAGVSAPNCASLGKADLYAFGRASAWSVPLKGRPPCRELLAVVQGPQSLRHGDRLVGPELSPLAHRVLDTLRRHFHEDAALQHRARVRVEDLVKSSMRSGGQIFAMSSKLWWSFARSCTVMILNVSAGTFTSL